MPYLTRFILLSAYVYSSNSFAHSFDERYALPIPLEYFLIAAAFILGGSFFLIAVSVRYWNGIAKLNFSKAIFIPSSPIFHSCHCFLQCCSVALLFLVIAAGYLGSQNPLMNLAPTFIWINWWIGVSLASALLGNFWPWINPWASLFDLLAHGLNKCGVTIKSRILIPRWFGLFPATILLLLWSWMEVVYPIAFVPHTVATMALTWTVMSVLGMAIVGKQAWQAHFDFFSIYFGLLGEFGIFGIQDSSAKVTLRIPGHGILLTENSVDSIKGLPSFIVAMLSIVLFDGIHGSGAWPFFQNLLQYLGVDITSGNGYLEGTIGLLSLWLLFLGCYYCVCYLSYCVIGTTSTRQIAHQFSRPLIPIAIAYLIAHNFSSLLIQGQSIIFLISDPFGRGWDLIGGAQYRPIIDLVGVGQIWYLAVTSIVIGHLIALVLTHIKAFQITTSARQANFMTLPQTIFMIFLTMISLIILAEPMTSSDFSVLRIWFGLDS